jgi:hypothetical protein
MSLADLAAIGSFVSGIAVVFSFIFLALQVRQANRNQRSLIQQARTGRNVEILLKMADEPISELLAKSESQAASLSPAKVWSFYGFVGAVFWSYEDCYMQFKAGTLEPGSWQSDVATLERILVSPAFRVIWRMVREGMSGGYRDYVDSLLNKVPADPSARFSDSFNALLSEELAAAGAG